MNASEGWRKMSHNRGFQNEVTGQIITVKKKEFGMQFLVWLISSGAAEAEGKKISPEFTSESRAHAFAHDWMKKNPNGVI